MAKTLAHELAHFMGVEHDGEPFYRESECPSNSFIMGANPGYDAVTFSKCTIDRLVKHISKFSLCAFDPNRIRASVPMNEMFDFTKTHRKFHEADASRACRFFFDLRSEAFYNIIKGHETCQSLCCYVDILEPSELLLTDPALNGSVCIQNRAGRSKGVCSSNKCVGAY